MSRKRPARPWNDRLRDIIEASAEARKFVEGMDYPAFMSDAKTRKAVLANLAIIGEAVSHLPDEIRKLRPSIPWDQVYITRNIVVHVYFGVDPQIVWDTVQRDLIVLERELSSLLAENPDLI